ncbi:hypothetical protein BKA70DRAFT_7166 [Coprinopsis sp. MPI-PUGE-AT-0042]|nr:hypothetical protein BKA70DRAFT_7166 [Coprinopsis sp. MPI-PUGE-AT-0042]
MPFGQRPLDHDHTRWLFSMTIPSLKRRRSTSPSLERIDEVREVKEVKTPRLLNGDTTQKELDFDESFLDHFFEESSNSYDDNCSRSFSLDEYEAARGISLLQQDLPMSRPQTPAPGAMSSSSSSFDSDDEGESEVGSSDEEGMDSESSESRQPQCTPRSPLAPEDSQPATLVKQVPHGSHWRELRWEFENTRPSNQAISEQVDAVAGKLARYLPHRVAQLLYEEGNISD